MCVLYDRLSNVQFFDKRKFLSLQLYVFSPTSMSPPDCGDDIPESKYDQFF